MPFRSTASPLPGSYHFCCWCDESKIEAVSSYPPPANEKQLRQFLGLANYYRRFVKRYAQLVSPLTKLLRKEFTLYTDASDVAPGAVLSQTLAAQERVVSYFSRQLQKAERRYSTIDREALAIVSAIKEIYPYLYGFVFTLVTDHNPLMLLKGLRDVGGKMTRWLLFLQQFHYKIIYSPGKCNVNADALSRIPVVAVVDTLIPSYTQQQIQDLQAQNTQLQPIIGSLKKGTALPSTVPPGLRQAFLLNDTLHQKSQDPASRVVYNQLIVSQSLCKIVFNYTHSQSGHLGIHKTLKKIRERFYWPGYESSITEWIQQCEACQKCNAPVPTPVAPFGTITASQPFEKVSWNIMGPLPTTDRGNQYILVVTDLFSKWVEAFPLASTTAETLATVLINQIVCCYGVPQFLHSDQGPPNITAKVIQSLCLQLGIDITISP
uniref:Integrase catalytic domain-containing protein n=1 Tax=Amphimedon queenslandica TaxID=400682 RepID=A0A1X7U411_AMPQE